MVRRRRRWRTRVGGVVARSHVPTPRPSHQEEAARGGCRAPARGRRAGAPRGPQRDERRSRGFALRRAHAHQHQALSLSVDSRLVGFLPPAGRLGRRSDRLTQHSRDHSPKQNGFRAASAFCATDGVGVRQSAATSVGRTLQPLQTRRRVAPRERSSAAAACRLATSRRRATISRAAHKSSNDARGRCSFAGHCSARARCETQDARRDAAARSCGAAV